MNTKQTYWAWINGQWAEIYGSGGGGYLTVDSRISRGTHFLNERQVHLSKPDWIPGDPTGERIWIGIERKFTSHQMITRTNADPMPLWWEFETEELENIAVSSVVITGLGGFQHTHRCSHCEEFAATDPNPHSPCKGCKATAWEFWEHEIPALGPVPKSRH